MTENIPPVDQPSTSQESSPRSRALRTRSVRAAQGESPTTAFARRDPARVNQALEHARIAARIADDNRARDILLLDLRQATPLLDFFVIATAASRRQANAIASEIDADMKKRGEHKLGMEGSEEGRWILIDYADFVVHVFSEEGRGYYALEEIWGDAPRLEWTADVPHPRPSTSIPPSTPPAGTTESGSTAEPA